MDYLLYLRIQSSPHVWKTTPEYLSTKKMADVLSKSTEWNNDVNNAFNEMFKVACYDPHLYDMLHQLLGNSGPTYIP